MRRCFAGRNGGHLTAYRFLNFRWLEKLFGKEEAIRGLELENYTANQIAKILQDNDKVQHVDFVQGGRVILLFTEREQEDLRAEFDAAKAAGVDVSEVQWLTKEEVQSVRFFKGLSRVGILKFSAKRWGSPYPAVLIPGNNLWPLKLVSVLFNLAQNASSSFSLDLHTRTPVTAVTPLGTSFKSGRRWNLATPRGNIACSYVLHATNGYAAHLLPWLHGPDGIVPTRGQVMAIRANTPGALGSTGFVANDGLEYWFPRQDNNEDENQLVILGGAREVKNDYEFHEVDDSVINPAVSKTLKAFLPDVFPGKFDVREPEIEWVRTSRVA